MFYFYNIKLIFSFRNFCKINTFILYEKMACYFLRRKGCYKVVIKQL